MRKQYSCKYKKGQWFLISAVVATGIFLAIAGVFKTYVDIETSKPSIFNEDYYFENIKQGLYNTASMSCKSEDIKEYIEFSKKEMARLGYLLNITYIAPCSIQSISIISEKMKIWEGEEPDFR